MAQADFSLSLANPHPNQLSAKHKLGLAILGLGLLSLALSWAGAASLNPAAFLIAALAGISVGSIIYIRAEYAEKPEGIKNNGVFFSSMSSRGALGWAAGVVFTGFYICLYFFPQYLQGLIVLFDPLSQLLRNAPSNQWFVYGTFYTLAVLIMGVKYIYKYRHNRYQAIRTGSVMFFQLGFAFLLPAILVRLNEPELYFSYFWPLDYDALWPGTIDWWRSSGNIGTFMVFWGAVMTFIATPILTYFYGKRWYCSWVCGCGGLAETAGDPYRQLSDKSLGAWKLERWLIYSVLAAITIITLLVFANQIKPFMGDATGPIQKGYGFLIGSIFSGVIGTGFYPILGSRVWCRFGCPMAAYLGLLQKFFSRFRITTNGGQCISCGNCSTYCEMGIDVRWYAQRGQNIVRASCVGCSVCSAVCPRGVLKLENGPTENRFGGPIEITSEGIRVTE